MEKQTVLDYYQTGTAVAQVLGLTRQAVSKWGDIIPELYALRLEKLSGGRLVYNETLYRSADERQIREDDA